MEIHTMYNYTCTCHPVRSAILSQFLAAERSPQGEYFISDSNQTITWTTASTGESVYEMAQPQNQQLYSETSGGLAEWGEFYFATGAVRRFDES
jgi:hypothetical protein